jgi:predicted nucleic acid-binding Zn ribbon protein
MKHKAELHPAFVWDCDDCGRENFVRAIVGEFDDDIMQQMRDEHGITDYEMGDWHSMPISVECSHCGTIFEVDDAQPD